MNTPDSLRALHRANPRSTDGFTHTVEAAAHAVRARIAADGPPRAPSRRAPPVPSRRLAAAVLAAAAIGVAAFVAVGSPGGGPGVEDAAAAVKQAATVTAASAELSGTAVLRITHDGETWADTTIRWNGGDLALANNTPDRAGRTGGGFRLVDGTVYGHDPRDGPWVAEGSPANIDPDSGTTPTELLAAVREDVGGATLPRLVESMTGLTTVQLDDGSTRYAGKVAAGLIARESGFKEGQSIRVLPFGNVAHGDAADPAAQIDAVIIVGADGIIRELTASWPGWTYRRLLRPWLHRRAPCAGRSPAASARPFRRAYGAGPTGPVAFWDSAAPPTPVICQGLESAPSSDSVHRSVNAVASSLLPEISAFVSRSSM